MWSLTLRMAGSSGIGKMLSKMALSQRFDKIYTVSYTVFDQMKKIHEISIGWHMAHQAHNLKVVGSNPTPATK